MRDVFERSTAARGLFASAATTPAPTPGLEGPKDGAIGGGNVAAAFDIEELTSLRPGVGSVRTGNIAAAFDIEELAQLRPDGSTSSAPPRLGVPGGVNKKV